MIETRYDIERGCGVRKPGGYYLVSRGVGAACGKLPIPLAKVCQCPDCGQLIYNKEVDKKKLKHSRAPRMLDNPSVLWTDVPCKFEKSDHTDTRWKHQMCPLGPDKLYSIKNAMLIWVGKKFYETPESYLRESQKAGISRRLVKGVPPKFVLGKTWVLLAHVNGIELETPSISGVTHLPTIFSMFLPDAVEYVVKSDESEEELKELLAKGVTPVKVKLKQENEYVEEQQKT